MYNTQLKSFTFKYFEKITTKISLIIASIVAPILVILVYIIFSGLLESERAESINKVDFNITTNSLMLQDS